MIQTYNNIPLLQFLVILWNNFAFPYYESADDVLIEGLSQNQDFFTLLLNNDDIKKEMLGIFLGEIYKEFRND